jgi:hypothetical protein
VNQTKSIVAIFKDERDAGLWAAYLDGISALWRITVHDDPAHTLERLIGLDPCLVILSSRLYPTEDPELVARIRGYFPKAELLVISSSEEPSPPLLPLWSDTVRHLAVNPTQGDPLGKEYFDCVLQKLVAGRPWTIDDRLRPQTEVSAIELRSSHQKEGVLCAVEAAIAGDGEEFEMFRQRGALLADELMENAMYGAPRDAAGGRLYRKGGERELLPEERLVFSFGFDGETLAMEMTDNWGTLDPDLVVEYLARNQAEPGSADDMGGRGLFLIWRFFDHFHVSILPGKKTVVGGDLQLSRRLDPESPRGFHITAQKGDAA